MVLGSHPVRALICVMDSPWRLSSLISFTSFPRSKKATSSYWNRWLGGSSEEGKLLRDFRDYNTGGDTVVNRAQIAVPQGLKDALFIIYENELKHWRVGPKLDQQVVN